ncbi:HpcH/HpaI aldolase family protein [Pararhizobium mangrovi]|uniref:HpcH/HpaI aldolase/citrate lyase family protein n=1 Tax=Pararhizobium mangrovi TaxID=2590452 RepID=A0A506U5A3_9HYPH|nr:HpcH/HpaI aldolase/citrate lyase family protein [Pararhizobium mangrovi]TPW28361.1 HpcH/HpaI aldolase/citrate lyase family protein [Pararhizobium mangrovi]
MNATANPFKAWFAGRDTVPLGTWLMAAAPTTAEALGHAGFDFVVVDMEHVPIEVADLAHILRAVGTTPAEPLVRLAWNDQVLVKRVLDAGAQTIMLPFVQTVEEARAAASFAKYPPVGVRGVAAVHRASRFGAAADYLKQANEETCVIVQLETPEAVDLLEEIAALPGIDAVFVGPGDLAASMGHIGEIGHPDVQAKIEEAAKRAAEVGTPIGIVGPNPEMVRRFQHYGYTFTAIASDVAMMTGRAREWLADLRGKEEAPSVSGAAY